MEKHAYGHIKQGLQPRSKYRLLILAGVFGVFCLWACAVFFWASCEIGSLFSYHPGLGRPVSLFGFVGYSPVTMLGWPSYIYDYEQVESTILIAQGVLVLVPIITGVVIVELCRRGESYQDLHGTAHCFEKYNASLRRHEIYVKYCTLIICLSSIINVIVFIIMSLNK